MSHRERREPTSGKTSHDSQNAHQAHNPAHSRDRSDGGHHKSLQSERSKSEHHSRNKGQVPSSRSKSHDINQRHQSESPHSHHSGKEASKSHELEHGNKNDICVCGPNIYGRFLGPTVDEQILAGLSALFEMCNECPEEPKLSDSETDPSQQAERAIDSESAESLERITTKPHLLGRSASKEESLRAGSLPKSLLKQESFQTASSERAIKISEESTLQKSLSGKKSAFSNVGSVNTASATERPVTRESSIITEPSSETSSSQTEAAAIEAKLKSLSNVSKESKEDARQCPCRVEDVCKCGPLLVCQSPSAVCIIEPSVESNTSESLEQNQPPYGTHPEQSQKLSSHSKSLSYSHQPPMSNFPVYDESHHPVHVSEHQIASHELHRSDAYSLNAQPHGQELSTYRDASPYSYQQNRTHDQHHHKPVHQPHYPETDPPCICPTCLPYEAAMHKQQKTSHHRSHHHLAAHHDAPQHHVGQYPPMQHVSPHRHQSPHHESPHHPAPGHHVSHQPTSHHYPPNHTFPPNHSTHDASNPKLHKSRSRTASGSPHKPSRQHSPLRPHSNHCQCPYCSTEHQNHSYPLKIHPSLHPFHPGINKHKSKSDECNCCECNDTTETSCNTIDLGCRQIQVKVNTKCKGSSTSSSNDGSTATKESSTSYSCIMGCPRASSARKSCASQFEDSNNTKNSSTSCTCMSPCPKKSALKRKAVSCKCSKSATQKLNGMCNKVKICGCSTSTTTISEVSEEAREELECGDSPKAVIRYAVTKITKFSSYTTFEVMKSTKKKPRTMPTKLEGVFVLRNRKCR